MTVIPRDTISRRKEFAKSHFFISGLNSSLQAKGYIPITTAVHKTGCKEAL